jgi:LAO/AO transport system kinase
LIERYRDTMRANGELAATRSEQARRWFWNNTADALLELLKDDSQVRRRSAELEARVLRGELSPRVAADELVKNFWKTRRSQ